MNELLKILIDYFGHEGQTGFVEKLQQLQIQFADQTEKIEKFREISKRLVDYWDIPKQWPKGTLEDIIEQSRQMMKI